MIYRLAVEGQGDSGQMGIKAIVKHLNAQGIFIRDGGPWGIGEVHRILTRRTYIGEHEWGKPSKHNDPRSPGEIVIVQVRQSSSRRPVRPFSLLCRLATPKPSCLPAW